MTTKQKTAEDIAVRFIESHGWKVQGRNVYPCERDKRCEIDIVATSEDGNYVLFVEVKAHKSNRITQGFCL